MANENSADKAKREAEEAARKEAEAKAAAEAKEQAEAADKAKREAARNAERKPGDVPVSARKPAAAAEAPHPTQAELDAMRNGTYQHGREVKADGKSVDYKTR